MFGLIEKKRTNTLAQRTYFTYSIAKATLLVKESNVLIAI